MIIFQNRWIMKQYLNSEQTYKLIELGLEKPCSIASVEPIYGMGGISVAKAYSIGELLSFLPKSIKVNDLFFTLCIYTSNEYWIVEYADIAFGTQARLCKEELIDGLFAEIVILKEEGVI